MDFVTYNQAGRCLEQAAAKFEARSSDAESLLVAIYQATREYGEWWTLRKWMDARDIYNEDLSDHRLIARACEHVLRSYIK